MSSFRLDEREQTKQLAAYFKGLEDRIAALERTNQLTNASIEDGSLDIYDDEGTLRASFGVQEDGTVAVAVVNSDPPPTPTPPTVTPALKGLTVGWDGQWADADTTPADFSHVQVHVLASADVEPDTTAPSALISAASGAEVAVVVDDFEPRWVRLVAINSAALAGSASDAVEGTATKAVGDDLVDGIVTEVKLAQEAVTEAKLALASVSSEKIQQGAVNDLLLADDAVTAAKLAAGAVDSTALGDGAVLAEKIAANAVTQAKLAANSVTALALADQAVTAAKVAAAAIDSTKIADAAVTAAKIGNAAVTTGKLAAQAVTINALTAALADTASQRWVDAMADPSVWTVTQSGTGASWTHLSGVADAPTGQTVGQAAGFIRIRGNVQIPYDPDVLYRVSARIRATAQPTTADVIYVGVLGVAADGTTLVNREGADSANSQHYVAASAKSVGTADGWVTVIGFLKGRAASGASGSSGPNNDPRSPGTVHANVKFIAPYVWLNYNNQASVAGTMQVDAVTVEALKTGVVDSVNLVAGSVTTAAIATDAVTATQIAAGAVTASEIAAGAVTTAKLAAGAVTAAEIAANTIVAGNLAASSVTAAALAAGSVQAAALAADSVAAGKIASDAITARELAAGAVTASEISAGAVTAAALAAGSVTTDKLTVAGGANLLTDPSFEGAYSAALVASSTYFTIDTTGNGSAKSLKVNAVNASVTTRSLKITTLPILAADQLFIAFDYLTSSDYTSTAVVKVYARWEDSTGATLGYGAAQASTPVLGGTIWSRPTATVTAPANTVQATIWAESYQAAAGTLWFDNVAIRPVVAGTQIADGAITTAKMTAGSIQGDRIAAGSLAADRIVSGSITTSQLNVTTAASVVQKLYDVGADAARWRTGGTSTSTASTPSNLTSVQVTDAQSGSYVMRAVGGVSGAWRPDVLIPFDPNVLYRITGTVRQTVAGSDTAQQRFYMGVAGVAADGTTLVNTGGSAAASSQHYLAAAAQNLTAGGGWQRFTGYLKGYAASGASGSTSAMASPTSPGVLHANARYISPLFYANYQNGTGTAELGMLTIEVVETGAVQTVNISDGAITAAKILAGAITTEKLTALGVTAEKIASLAVTTDKLAALAVTADKIAANAITATQIAAGSIEATHIKAGAITTSALAADAITGKTITGGTITGATVTGGVLRTAASGQRVVVDPGGSNEVGSVKFFSGSTNEGNPAQVVTNIAYASDASGDHELPSVSLVAPTTSGSEQSTGLYLAPLVSGYGGAHFNLYANNTSGAGIARINGYGALSSAAGSSLELFVQDAPSSYTSAYARLTSSGLSVTGVFKAESIATGRVTITPSAANTPTSVTVTGLSLSGTTFRAVATPSTSVPGTSVTGVGVTNVSATGLTIWVTRTNTTSTGIDWIVIAS
ncbi:beta strand repeat-containing protein [Streptomyces sp. NPDC001536]|uniref:beta strand repeat-containing protein n=1 Tax=Streptomyces sp. NPDC001536 TaxID=3364583 RepID=UPI00368B8F6C